MTEALPQEVEEDRTRTVWSAFALVAGAGWLVLVLAQPAIDRHWESHPTHFWLVLVAASLNVVLGYAVGTAARRRRDARLFLVSLAFVSAASRRFRSA